MIRPVHNKQLDPVLQGMEASPHLLSPGKIPVQTADRGDAVSTDLSPGAVLLSEEGLDFGASSVETLSGNMDFNLEFTSSSVERLSVSGYYSEETGTLNLSWHFTFQKEVVVEGRAELRTFEADLQVSVSQVNHKTVTPYVRKEDIMSLVRRILRDIEETVADDDKVLGGVVLDYKDFRELFALENGKLIHDLMALIELTVILARLRQKLEGDEEVVILAPEREETRGISVTETSMRMESFHLEVRDVTIAPAAETGELSASDAPDDATGLKPAAPSREGAVPDSPPAR
ncbi:MAG: hypothetical protein JSU77_10540 [Fidelibacterota bacterium]|nr:MAG: hypothetical protein JSU77_10540 [Candidatus Neomarinimicrobiota bacterium]